MRPVMREAPARQGPPPRRMQAYDDTPRSPHHVHPMAWESARRLSGRAPHYERRARDGLGACAYWGCGPFWAVLGTLCGPLSLCLSLSAGGRPVPARRLCPTGSSDGSRLVLLRAPAGVLSVCPTMPRRLASGRSDTRPGSWVCRTPLMQGYKRSPRFPPLRGLPFHGGCAGARQPCGGCFTHFG
jgi:hypothetical protein